VIAHDANPVDRIWTADSLLLAAGTRFDVLVQGGPAGRTQLQTLAYDTGPAGNKFPQATLATLVTEGPAVHSAALPTSPFAPTDDLSHAAIAARRTLVFSENKEGTEFYINGKQFDPNRVTFSPRIDTTEEWTIHNVTKEEHPFHIHVNDFQVMSINGRKVDSKSLRDTVPLPVGGTVVIRMRFTQFLGRYVFHCHILAHEDGGMMAVVDVTEDGKPSPAPTTDVTGAMPGM
jgi:FtsP/CotA-like multicopper oxidase with cupredoxin domain